MPFEPAIERAAGEAQRLGRLAHVPAGARERLLDQDALDLLEAHLIERARAVGAGPKPKSRARTPAPSDMRTARSTACSSSRTFPGQEWRSSTSIASDANPSFRLLW